MGDIADIIYHIGLGSDFSEFNLQRLIVRMIDTWLVVCISTASEPSYLNWRTEADWSLSRNPVLKNRRIAQVRW